MLRCLMLVLLFIPLFSAAQEDKSLTELGDEAYARQEYAVAANLYGQLAEKKGRKAPLKILEKIASCYVEMARFEEAGYYYQQMMERPDCPLYITAMYGEKQMNLGVYDTAQKYLSLYKTANTDSLQWKNRMLAGCDSAILWKKEQQSLALENIKELSSTGADWVSGVVKDGLLLVSNGYRKMALSTGSERDPKIDPRVNQPYFKPYIFKQYQKGSNANTYLEEVLPKLLGKLPYHVGPVCFNSREDTVYVTLNTANKELSNKTKKGPVNGERLMSLYMSVKTGDSWSELTPMTALNHAGTYTGDAVLSDNGQLLYFVSDRPGGMGKTDIWYSERLPDGSWGAPANCGAMINTPWEETFPTVNEAGALYFSSKGHIGMGGFDIFRAIGRKASWSKPVNLRCPFNSGADDLGFIMKENMYEGYFASNRAGGSGGDDVYHFMDTHCTEKLQQPEKKPAPEQPIAGMPQPSKKDGRPPVDTAVISKLEQLCFYYDYNSAVLLNTSRELLDRVAVVLKEHPDWKLMVRSYADSRGSDSYNTDLTALRCYAVIDYLIKQGLTPRNLYYENMGEKDLVNNCGDGMPCSEEEHRKNRRTMLKIIY